MNQPATVAEERAVLPSGRAWLLCGLLFCATALSFLDRQALSVLAPQLTAEFGMSNTAYSRFFSGTERYHKSFVLPAGWKSDGRQIDLDLGNLWVIGQVWLNGKPLGVLWTPPFRADCADATKWTPIRTNLLFNSDTAWVVLPLQTQSHALFRTVWY